MSALVTLADLDQMACTPGICAYCRRDTMVYALAEFTCRKCVLEDVDGLAEAERQGAPEPAEEAGQ